MIPQGAVNAVAKHNFELNYREVTWAELGDDIKAGWLEEAQGQCEAAAPWLRAQAMEDAAQELAQLQYVSPFSDPENRSHYESMLAIRRGNTDAWLKARAVTERGEG